MYEIKVEESETLCPKCGKLLSAVRVRQSGAIPANIFEAVLAEGATLTPDMGGKATTVELGKAIAAAVPDA